MAISKQDIENGVDKAKDKMEEGYQDTKDTTRSLVSNAKDMAANMTDKVSEYVKEGSSIVKDKALTAQNLAAKYIRDNPWKAVGISVVTGMLAALCFRRRD